MVVVVKKNHGKLTMAFLCPFLWHSCNTGGNICIICFVWLKVTASSIHVSLSIKQAFVFCGTLITIGLFVDICLVYIKSWHSPKCHSLSSFSCYTCKEHLYIRNILFHPTLPLEVVVIIAFNKIWVHLLVLAFC